ncbi:MAG: Gfo/Idh/MocA family oxidoreductase, partial [Sphingobacteriales bacterium]
GIIGCGHISDKHISSWKMAAGSTIAGIYDISRELAASKAAKHGMLRVYDSMQELINDCDVLDICTPPQTHYSICMDVIAAGKHMIVEKPIVTDLGQWEAIRDAVQAAGITLVVLHNLKFNLCVQKAKQAIDAGKIGKLIRINRYFLTHPDHDRMLVGNKHWSHKLPGGRWFETMPHELYLTHYFAGWSELEHVTVLSTPEALQGAPADEVCFVLSNDRVISSYHYSSNCRLNKRFIEFIGTDGVITLDVLSDMMFLDAVKENKRRRGIGIMAIEAWKRLLQVIPDRMVYLAERRKGISPHTRIILQFDQYLDGKAENPTPFEEIDFVVRYCDIVGKEIDRKLSKNQLAVS